MSVADDKDRPIGIDNLAVHHNRRQHIHIIGSDLTTFGHIHPDDFPTLNDVHDNVKGLYRIAFTFPSSGKYAFGLEAITYDDDGKETLIKILQIHDIELDDNASSLLTFNGFRALEEQLPSLISYSVAIPPNNIHHLSERYTHATSLRPPTHITLAATKKAYAVKLKTANDVLVVDEDYTFALVYKKQQVCPNRVNDDDRLLPCFGKLKSLSKYLNSAAHVVAVHEDMAPIIHVHATAVKNAEAAEKQETEINDEQFDELTIVRADENGEPIVVELVEGEQINEAEKEEIVKEYQKQQEVEEIEKDKKASLEKFNQDSTHVNKNDQVIEEVNEEVLDLMNTKDLVGSSKGYQETTDKDIDSESKTNGAADRTDIDQNYEDKIGNGSSYEDEDDNDILKKTEENETLESVQQIVKQAEKKIDKDENELEEGQNTEESTGIGNDFYLNPDADAEEKYNSEESNDIDEDFSLNTDAATTEIDGTNKKTDKEEEPAEIGSLVSDEMNNDNKVNMAVEKLNIAQEKMVAVMIEESIAESKTQDAQNGESLDAQIKAIKQEAKAKGEVAVAILQEKEAAAELNAIMDAAENADASDHSDSFTEENLKVGEHSSTVNKKGNVVVAENELTGEKQKAQKEKHVMKPEKHAVKTLKDDEEHESLAEEDGRTKEAKSNRVKELLAKLEAEREKELSLEEELEIATLEESDNMSENTEKKVRDVVVRRRRHGGHDHEIADETAYLSTIYPESNMVQMDEKFLNTDNLEFSIKFPKPGYYRIVAAAKDGEDDGLILSSYTVRVYLSSKERESEVNKKGVSL
eukprot:CFRG3150T1